MVRLSLTFVVGGGLALKVISVGVAGTLMAADRPETALSWWPDSTSAASAVAEKLAEAGELDKAQIMAIQALRGSAQDSRALRALADVSRQRGNTEISSTAIVISAHLGWRDGFAQWWVFEQALNDQDVIAASQSGDALLRINFQTPEVWIALKRMVNTAEGRAALAERMSAKPMWSEPFLTQFRAGSPQEARDFGRLMMELDARGARPDDELVQPFFLDLIARGEFKEALTVWRWLSRASGDPTAGAVDGGFTELASGARGWGPFSWRTLDVSNVTLRTPTRTEFSADPALEVTIDGTALSRPIHQLLILPPGTYEFVFDAKLHQGSRHAFRWEIVCLSSRAELIRRSAFPSPSSSWSLQRLEFTVPAANCEGQTLRLLVGPARQESASASFDNLSIRHIR